MSLPVDMMITRGVVEWFNDAKGYGWVAANGIRVFVHYTAIEGEGFKTLAEGQVVLLTVIDGPKGPQAANVIRTQEFVEVPHAS